jgi:hypothetical protein
VAVTVQVAADAQQATAEFNRLNDILRRTGQAGKALGDIDFSHPELKEVEADLRRIEERWREIQRVGRSETASGVRAGIRQNLYSNPLEYAAGAARQYAGNQDEATRRTAQIGRIVLEGTSGALPPVPPPPPQSDDDEEEDENEKRRRRRGGGDSGGGEGGDGALSLLLSPFKAAIGFTLAQAGLSGTMNAITSHYGDAEREDVMNDDLLRRLNDAGAGFDELRNQVRSTSESIHVLQTEGQALTAEWVKLTSTTREGDAASAVSFAGGVARGFGVAPGMLVHGLGEASALGEDPRRFALLLGEAMHQGNQTGQIETVLSALLHWTETATRLGYENNRTDAFASMYAGLNATGSPALRGANAEALINQMNAAFMHGGAAGLPGQILTYEAFRQHGVSDPYEVQYRMSQGMFAPIRDGGPTGYEAVRDAMSRMYAGTSNYRRWDAEANYWGITPGQAQQLDRFKPADLSFTQKYLADAGIDLSKVNSSGLGDILKAMDPRADIEAMRKELLGRQGDQALSADEAKSLREAQDPEDIRKLLVQDYGRHGLQKTEGQEIIQASARFSNALSNAASILVEPVNALKDQLSYNIGPTIQRIAEALERAYPSTHMDDLSLGSDLFGNGIDAPPTPELGDKGNPEGPPVNGQMNPSLMATIGNGVTHNPLNLMFNGQQEATGKRSNGVAMFPTLRDGIHAEGRQLLYDQERHGAQSIADIIRQWDTSPGDAPKLPGYIGGVARTLGVDPNAPFDLRHGDNLANLIMAMAPHETGKIGSWDQDKVFWGANDALADRAKDYKGPKPLRVPMDGVSDAPQGVQVEIRTTPLTVIHKDAKGAPIATEHLPVTTVTAPKAAGAAAPQPARVLNSRMGAFTKTGPSDLPA